MYKLDLEKAEESEIKLPISAGSQRKKGDLKKEKKKNICFVDYRNAFDCVGHSKLWKVLKEIDHLTCPLRNLCAEQEAIVMTLHGID